MMSIEEIKEKVEKLSNLWSNSLYTEAIELANQLIEEQILLNDKRLLSSVYRDLGLVYLHQSDLLNGLDYLERALHLNEDIEDKNEIGGNLVNIGLVYNGIGEYKKALEYFEKATFILNETDNKKYLANALMNIGNVYLALKDYERALEFYEKSLQINESINNKLGIANSLSNIGLVSFRHTDYTKGVESILKALQINEELNNKVGVSNNLGNLGVIYINILEFNIAFEYLHQAIQINDEIGNKYSKTANLISIGAIYASQESDLFDVEKAEDYLKISLELSEEIGAKALTKEAYNVLYQIRFNQRNFEESLKYKLKSIDLELELNSIEAKKQAERIDVVLKSAEREKQVAIERTRYEERENILRNILPDTVTDRLVKGENPIADHIQSATVLFMDLVGFTSLASIAPAKQLVYVLDSIFTKADEVVEQFGLEKIKTIGDGYLAVANVTTPLKNHQQATALAALQLLETMKDFVVNIPSDLGDTSWIQNMKDIEIRIGIHTGEVVAGIIGKNKYTYDLWGDAVNIASRMESNSEAGRIHISEAFAKSIDSNPEFLVIPRGEIHIKGKGTMNTYWLEKAR